MEEGSSNKSLQDHHNGDSLLIRFGKLKEKFSRGENSLNKGNSIQFNAKSSYNSVLIAVYRP